MLIKKGIKINLLKKRGPTEIRTRINGFKVQCANRYTIGPINIYKIFFLFNNLLNKNKDSSKKF